jgi:hypothetical protein
VYRGQGEIRGDADAAPGPSVLVPVVAVGGVPVAVVDVVHVVAVLDGLVPAAGAVLMGMVVVDDMAAERALVPVPFVLAVHVPVVQVVSMVAVLDSDVTTVRPVLV